MENILAEFSAVVLAAGKSTRMKSDAPKAVHPICGKSVTRYVVDACHAAGASQVIVVVGHEAETVKRAIGDDVTYVLQKTQKGTGHAVIEAAPFIKTAGVLVLPGDAPLIRPETLQRLVRFHRDFEAAATLLTAMADDPGSYGRIIRASDGGVLRIVEARDADAAELDIKEISTSMYCFDSKLLQESLKELRTDNAQGEYYLTDTVEILRKRNCRVGGLIAENPQDTLGINTRIELAEASQIMRRRLLDRLMLGGVTIVDPNTTYVDVDVTIGRDTTIFPCTVIEGDSRIGEHCTIGPFAKLADVNVPSGSVVQPFQQGGKI